MKYTVVGHRPRDGKLYYHTEYVEAEKAGDAARQVVKEFTDFKPCAVFIGHVRAVILYAAEDLRRAAETSQ